MDNALGRVNYAAFISWLAEFHQGMEGFLESLPWEKLNPYAQCAFQAGAEAVLGAEGV